MLSTSLGHLIRSDHLNPQLTPVQTLLWLSYHFTCDTEQQLNPSQDLWTDDYLTCCHRFYSVSSSGVPPVMYICTKAVWICRALVYGQVVRTTQSCVLCPLSRGDNQKALIYLSSSTPVPQPRYLSRLHLKSLIKCAIWGSRRYMYSSTKRDLLDWRN